MLNNIKPQSIFQTIITAGLPGVLLFTRNIVLFFVTRRRDDLSQNAVVDDSAFIQILFTVLIFIISAYILFTESHKKRILFRSPQIYLLLYTIVGLISMFWAPNMFLTGFRAFESLTYILLFSITAYNLVLSLDIEKIVEWTILWIIWDIFWSIVTLVKFSGLGVLIWPFEASRLAVPMVFFFALMLNTKKALTFVIIAFSILSTSNKIYFGMALGMLGFLWGDSRYKGWLIVSLIGVCTTLIFIDINDLLINTLFYGRESVSLNNTSGRNQLWSVAWQAFLEKPIWGYGFVSGENAVLYSKFPSGAMNSHNSIFSGLLGTGIVGTAFIVLYFYSSFQNAISNYFPTNRWKPAMVSTFIMGLVISLTAPGIGSRVYGSWIPVVFIFTIISALQYKFEIVYKYNKTKN